MSGAGVRAIGAHEVDAVLPLFCAYLAFYGVAREPAEARAFLHERLSARESLVLLGCLSNGEPAGFAQVYFGFSSLSLARVWTLNDLYVDETARGSGLGRRLVREVCRRAADAGALRVQLETAQDNAVAKALYAAEGFSVQRGFEHLSRPAEVPWNSPGCPAGI
jgi:ribosomal protein S18 acetylase RimI-like enzyme